jgi:activator of 2-hydroxyglutaryl-CoA dehydratase
VLGGADTANLAAGITRNVAQYVMRLVYKVDIEKDIAITGGIAKNTGFIKYLQEMMGIEFVELPEDPQLIGAIGAAVFAADQLTNPD